MTGQFTEKEIHQTLH